MKRASFAVSSITRIRIRASFQWIQPHPETANANALPSPPSMGRAPPQGGGLVERRIQGAPFRPAGEPEVALEPPPLGRLNQRVQTENPTRDRRSSNPLPVRRLRFRLGRRT